MRLSQRADYAAHAMVEIARWYGERPVHATEIAQRQGIPEPYLEQLLLLLRPAVSYRPFKNYCKPFLLIELPPSFWGLPGLGTNLLWGERSYC